MPNNKLRTSPLKGFMKSSPLHQLVGGQKKLDKNKDGKLDKEDFEMLRGEKSSPLNANGMGSYNKGMMMGGGFVNEGEEEPKKEESEKLNPSSGGIGYTFKDGSRISFKKEGGRTSEGGRDVTTTFTNKLPGSSKEITLRKKRVEQASKKGPKEVTKAKFTVSGDLRKIKSKKGRGFKKQKQVFRGEKAANKFKLKFRG